ncbi:putative bacteriophage protein [Escherichia coli]|uniref:Putative bacteriophage protein n=1 Tax=Escherichia coli TaxID=562 RepID=A0A376P2C2_ECOLX|nr:putative bacteriophage protein [Escherichia coli]
MNTNYEATVATTDNIVHEVYLEGKHIGYVIKTENKETPFTVVDIDGLSGNFKTLVEGATKMCLVYIGNNLPAEKSRISGNSDCNEIKR